MRRAGSCCCGRAPPPAGTCTPVRMACGSRTQWTGRHGTWPHPCHAGACMQQRQSAQAHQSRPHARAVSGSGTVGMARRQAMGVCTQAPVSNGRAHAHACSAHANRSHVHEQPCAPILQCLHTMPVRVRPCAFRMPRSLLASQCSHAHIHTCPATLSPFQQLLLHIFPHPSALSSA